MCVYVVLMHLVRKCDVDGHENERKAKLLAQVWTEIVRQLYKMVSTWSNSGSKSFILSLKRPTTFRATWEPFKPFMTQHVLEMVSGGVWWGWGRGGGGNVSGNMNVIGNLTELSDSVKAETAPPCPRPTSRPIVWLFDVTVVSLKDFFFSSWMKHLLVATVCHPAWLINGSLVLPLISGVPVAPPTPVICIVRPHEAASVSCPPWRSNRDTRSERVAILFSFPRVTHTLTSFRCNCPIACWISWTHGSNEAGAAVVRLTCSCSKRKLNKDERLASKHQIKYLHIYVFQALTPENHAATVAIYIKIFN